MLEIKRPVIASKHQKKKYQFQLKKKNKKKNLRSLLASDKTENNSIQEMTPTKLLAAVKDSKFYIY